MTSFTRLGTILLTGTACLALTACGGADDVASPGAGTVIITPPATPTPTTPTPTTPTAITAAQFASTSGARLDGSITITADEQLAIVNAGTNNNVNGTNVLNGVYPIAATSAATATDPSSINPFFTSTNFVGALNGPTDTAFQDWTCSAPGIAFGGNGGSCSTVPAIGAGGAAAACPTGTIDDGLVQTFRACRLPINITTSLTLPKIAGVFYRLRGQTEVGSDVGTTGADTGVTLTIAPGVVIAADSTETTADLLLVNRGSKINAVGTRAAPIIFTGQQNLGGNANFGDGSQGLWGGIILLGRAPVAVCATGTGPNNANGTSTTCQQAIEGVTGRFYGGPTQADNSGTMQYVQIRYSGIAISDGNELQGLTLGGTGSGTTIDHVQSHKSADDGIEIFGGTTNIRYFAVTGADDDGYDIDNGYRGFMQFMIAIQKASGATADSFSTEIDSNGAEDLLPRTFGQYSNFTFVQTAFAPAAIRQRGGSDMRFINGIVKTPANVACLNLIAQETRQADRSTIRAADASKQDQGPPIFTSVYFNCNGR